MRISDWSSDVCSSDLDKAESAQPAATSPKPVDQAPATKVVSEPKAASTDTVPASRAADRNDNRRQQASSRPDQASDATQKQEPSSKSPRSEEHTSALQSLMRISYAVLRLNKNNTQHNHTN